MSYQKQLLMIFVMGLVACGGVNKKVATDPGDDGNGTDTTGQTDPNGGDQNGEGQAMALNTLDGNYTLTISGVEAPCEDVPEAQEKYKGLLEQSTKVSMALTDTQINIASGEALRLSGELSKRQGNEQVAMTLEGPMNMGEVQGDVVGIVRIELGTKKGRGALDLGQTKTANDKACEGAQIEFELVQEEANDHATRIRVSYAGELLRSYQEGEALPFRITEVDEDEGAKYFDVEAQIPTISGRVVKDAAEGCVVEEEVDHTSKTRAVRVECDTQSDRELLIQTSGK